MTRSYKAMQIGGKSRRRDSSQATMKPHYISTSIRLLAMVVDSASGVISLVIRMDATHQPSSQPRREELPRSIYSRYIKSCFNSRPSSGAYYKQLLDFLDSGNHLGTSHLQTPHCYEITDKSRDSTSIDCPIFKEIESSAPCSQPRIAILEGFPSPESIDTMGAEELIRPELFIGHLDFSRNEHSLQRYYELPALPSDRSNIIHVRLATLGQSFSRDTETRSYTHERMAADKKCFDFENQLFHRKHYGATRFRKVHIHNSRTVSVEQLVSFTVTQRPDQPWCGKSVQRSIICPICQSYKDQESSFQIAARVLRADTICLGLTSLEEAGARLT